MTRLDPAVLSFYERGEEAARLAGASHSGPLEVERTRELVLRHLPAGPLRILDVGGGPGVHAAWLVALGHHVRVIDPVPLHVEQAAAADARIVAELGDARDLDAEDRSVDVVLLMGPLYHLLERDDRLAALAEAARVLRPGGLVFAAAICRHAALLDLLLRLDRLHEPDVLAVATEAVTTGAFRGADVGLFTTAYFHRPRELAREVAEAGLTDDHIYGVEGPGFFAPDLADRWRDPARREALLQVARLVESDPDVQSAGSHLLAVARRPS